MGMQIPNAAGFIPSQSVIDGIAKIYDMFSPEARKKREAEVAYLQAQTGAKNTDTAYAGDRSAQGWAGIGNDTTRANATATNAVTQAGHLPLLSRELDIKSEGQDMGERQWLLDFTRRNQQFSEEMRQKANEMDINRGMLQNDTTRTQQQGMRFKTEEDEARRMHEEREKLQNQDAMFKVWQGLAMDPNMREQKDQVMYRILADSMAPEAAQAMIAHFKKMDAYRDQYRQKLQGKVPGPDRNPYTHELPKMGFSE